MSVTLSMRVNYEDAAKTYASYPASYITMDLVNDYLIWTEGNSTVKDLMTSTPTSDELTAAGAVISDTADRMVPLCLLYDYSHDVGGSYYTHKVIGMGENKRYVFCFSFDGATATEPTLEAWDDTNHTTTDKNVLGDGTPANSMVKAVCTTLASPGSSWTGTALAGSNSARTVLLNGGNGALTGSSDLYANIKIVIPQAYATPGLETFVLTVRYAWA